MHNSNIHINIHTVYLRDTGTGTRKKWVVWYDAECFTLHGDQNPIVSYCAGPGVYPDSLSFCFRFQPLFRFLDTVHN